VLRLISLENDQMTAVQQIDDWLKKLGLEQYAHCFAENDIDLSILHDLTDQDLEKIGVRSLGHRRRLLQAIEELRALSGSTAPLPRPPQGSAERRQLTIMFCDLVGSTALSTQLDPEELREIISSYHRCCAQVIEKSGGFVARYLGDGVLAYFGFPQAHENDAERAVRAGLALVAAIPKLEAGKGPSLRVRVGIATGLVVVGDLIGEGGSQEQAVVGETPNLAARLQALAEPDTVVIASNTRRLLGELFEYRPLGSTDIKGFGRPLEVWQVIGTSTVDSRFEALRGTRTPLVDREEEIDLLMRRWGEAKGGNGCVVLISGEPGIGKSRIVQSVLERLSNEPHTRLQYFCSPHHQDNALYPSITQLERAAGFKRGDTAEQRLDKLEAVLAQATNEVSEVVPLFAELLSIPTSDRYPPLNLTTQKRKQKIFLAKIAQVEGLAARRPVLMVSEDVQWIDPSSLELLEMNVERLPVLPVLLIITFRPDFRPPWVGLPHVTLLSLNRLTPRHRAEMIGRVTQGKALPKQITEQIIDRTDGVPLFVEELTKAVVESGMLAETGDRYVIPGPSPPLAVPSTLHDSLMARLDRLSPVREVAQIAAAIGRQFSYELISSIASMTQQQLDDALERLVVAELIFRRGTPPDAEYTFKHALVQEAAYQSALRSKRQQYHLQIVQTLERQFPEIRDAQPHILAHHYTEANLTKESIPYWQKAGEKAVQSSANAEAVNHFTKGLELLKAMPESPDRFQKELELQLALGTPLIAIKGFAAPEVGRIYARARELCQLAGETPQLFPVYWGLWVFYTARAEHMTAHELAKKCQVLAAAAGNADLVMEAHHALGVTLLSLGDFSSGLQHLEQAIAIYDPKRHSTLAFIYGQDSGIVCRCHAAWALWFLGYPEQAMKRNEEALILARELSHPYSLAVALDFSAWLHQLFRDRHATREQADAAIVLSTEHDFPFWMLMGMILRGSTLVQGDQIENGIAQIREALTAYCATGAEIMRPYYLALLAEAYGLAGQFKEGLDLIDEALKAVNFSRECWCEAELFRLKGELTLKLVHLQSSAPESQQEAENYFRRALNTASRQRAKSLELRSALSLSRLWQRQDKRAEARLMLAEVCAWFTDGFETADLRESKLLLGELS
jgi:class 3 adenylate cyclase/predicted ATPase